MILQNASVPEQVFLHEQPNKNLRGGGEAYFWESDHLGLNFAGWSCLLVVYQKYQCFGIVLHVLFCLGAV